MKAQESWLSTEQHFQGHNEVQSWVTWSVDEVSRLGQDKGFLERLYSWQKIYSCMVLGRRWALCLTLKSEVFFGFF